MQCNCPLVGGRAHNVTTPYVAPCLRPARHVVFLHINKCGGTTVKEAIEAHRELTGERQHLQCISKRVDWWVAPGRRTTLRRKSHPRTIAVGDYCMGVHRFFQAPTVYMMMLRDPRSRTISAYMHCKLEPYDQVSELSPVHT